ncbi:MAG TPA: hypothetical protein VFH59_17935 [Frateuria sp.]|uniref:hypothetical protein n=1 Tax=Frateuria sp. TaxID=2211372 RepID=UPI002D7FFBD4|nr:hypothetical protein [Frateuria sp.]HET6807319.1 hypothetical protein [Frateuria sp.]
MRQNRLSFPTPGARSVWPSACASSCRTTRVEVYKTLKNDLPAFNDDPSWTLPMPGRFVIGQDGSILYAEVNPDYSRRPDPEEVLPVLRQAAQSRAA